MKNISLLFLALFVIFSSCKGGSTKTTDNQVKENNETLEQQVKPFVLPEIPIIYTEPESRAEYLSTHYWDNFDFSDTLYIDNKEITEQEWANFINILNHTSLSTAQEAVKIVFDKAQIDKRVYKYFAKLAEDYLHDPNSPYRNEEFYIPVLESIVESDVLDETEKIRPKDRLKMAYKNRVGTKAANFTYTLKSGKRGTLYNLSADYILLYFHNPGCHACGEISEQLKSSLQISHKTARKEMIILTVYPDEELDEWDKHLHEFPTTWINGYDKEVAIQNKNMYDLKAIPTIYLLDKNKNVLLKDTTVPALEEYLRSH